MTRGVHSCHFFPWQLPLCKIKPRDCGDNICLWQDYWSMRRGGGIFQPPLGVKFTWEEALGSACTGREQLCEESINTFLFDCHACISHVCISVMWRRGEKNPDEVSIKASSCRSSTNGLKELEMEEAGEALESFPIFAVSPCYISLPCCQRQQQQCSLIVLGQ